MPDLSNAHSDGVSSFVSVQLSRAPAPSSATVTTLKLIGWNYEPPLVQEIGGNQGAVRAAQRARPVWAGLLRRVRLLQNWGDPAANLLPLQVGQTADERFFRHGQVAASLIRKAARLAKLSG